MKKYAVVGHPIEHSRSPEIHAAFAASCGISMSYERILAPLDGFIACLSELRNQEFCGVNVTVPFKLEAFACSSKKSSAALWAGAVNTLIFTHNQVFGDNTDGVGLVRDIEVNLHQSLAGKRILLLGAGGAARGVLRPILLASPLSVTVKNRSLDKAQVWLSQIQKIADFKQVLGSCSLSVEGWGDDPLNHYDVVINATASGLANEFIVPCGVVFSDGAFAYDMMYGKKTAFLKWAHQHQARIVDGWGMLVEQAAESFNVWHGVMPDTQALLRGRYVAKMD